MSEYAIELSSESINGSMNYKRKFNMTGDIDGGGVLVVNVTAAGEVRTCDKTAGEMWAAYLSGGVVLSAVDDGDTYCDTIISATEKSGSYTFYDATGNYTLSAATADDYPSAGSGPK